MVRRVQTTAHRNLVRRQQQEQDDRIAANAQVPAVRAGGAGTGYASAAQGALADSAVQSIVAGENITVDATDPKNPIIAAAASGGGSLTIISSVATAQFNGPATTSTTNVAVDGCTLVIPGSVTPRTAYVSFLLNINRDTHLSLALDGVTFYPKLSFFGGAASTSDSFSGTHYEGAWIPVPIPGDGLDHTLGLEHNAESSTGQCIFKDRYIVAVIL